MLRRRSGIKAWRGDYVMLLGVHSTQIIARGIADRVGKKHIVIEGVRHQRQPGDLLINESISARRRHKERTLLGV